MLAIYPAAVAIFLSLVSCMSPNVEVPEQMASAAAAPTGEQHGKNELSLYDFTAKIIGGGSGSRNAKYLLEEFQVRQDRGRVADKFPSDVDVITRSCGTTKNPILLEIEEVVCSSNASAYAEVSMSAFFMQNDIFSYPQEEIDKYFAGLAASTLMDFGKLAESRGFRRQPLAADAANTGHLPNPYSLSAFVGDGSRLLLIQHETVPRIAKVAGSPAVVKVSLFTPDESDR